MPQVKSKIRCMEQRHSYCMVVKTKVPGGIVPQFIILVQHVTICIIRGRNKSNYLKFLISNGRITIVPVLLIVIYIYIYMVSYFSHVQLFASLWTVACQAPLSRRFFSKNTGVGCHALLQGIFPTQGSDLHLLCLLN